MYRDERFRQVMDHMPVLIWCSDTNGRIVYLNRIWDDFSGCIPADEIDGFWRSLVHPDDLDGLTALLSWRAPERKPFELEARMRRHDGVWRTMLCSGVPRADLAGEFAGFAGYCLDLSDRRDVEAQLLRHAEEQAALLQELHHRVKNNAQVFASLLRVQAGRAPDPAVRAGLRAAAARASTIALVQQQIWDTGSASRFDLAAFARRLARAQGHSRIETTVDVPAVLDVPLATAVPFALILHELLTNALRHGFPQARPDSAVRVAAHRDRSNSLTVEVSDNGVGAAEAPAEQAGLTIVRSLVRQLGATWSMEIAGGTRAKIVASCPAPA